MSTHLSGFQSFSGFLHHFVFAKLATSSLRVNAKSVDYGTVTTRMIYVEEHIGLSNSPILLLQVNINSCSFFLVS